MNFTGDCPPPSDSTGVVAFVLALIALVLVAGVCLAVFTVRRILYYEETIRRLRAATAPTAGGA